MALNKWYYVAIGVAILAALGAGAFFYLQSTKHAGLQKIVVGDENAYVYVADTDAKRELGLGGREKLAPDEGMLFIFPIEGKFPFWMKDMKFPIDILWIASDGGIIYIEENVSPETFPQQFAPESGLARYVLELPAGYSVEHHLDVGEKVDI